MAEDKGMQMFLKKMIPKVLKATVMGLLWFFLLYALPTLFLSELVEEVLPGYTQLLSIFAIVIVFFVVVSELLAGTIFQYAFNIGKALVFMAFFIYALNGGFIAFDLEFVHIEADLRVYLAMLLTIDFLGLAKSLLQAIDFLGKKTERQLAI
ncbi:MAG: hypothetical protein OEZ35_03135 [Candidatus Bathyarchaeota archaeon]|nr:hypothetical protein [Candidatus Bathyarchaeota archaeon]